MSFTVFNGPAPTTAAQAAVTTGAVIKTMLQLKPIVPIKITAWGGSFNGSAAAVPPVVELCETGTIFGTVTAFVEADVIKHPPSSGLLAANALNFGTATSGYTCTSEGSIVAVRTFDAQLLPPTFPFVREYALGREIYCTKDNCVRIRVTAPVAVSALFWVTFELA